jgi:mono/diheme cytochrome c family protein
MRLTMILLFTALLVLAGSQAAMAAGNAAKGKQIYMTTCIACHNADPSKPGAIGPEVKGSSKALISARVLTATYPKGYKAKRPTKMMPPMPHLKANIDDLAAFLK